MTQCAKHGGDCSPDACCDTDYRALRAEIAQRRVENEMLREQVGQLESQLLDVRRELINTTKTVICDGPWKTCKYYRCLVALIPEEDGQVSSVVVNLPGAGSCGATEVEALENVKESVRGLIESYEADGEPIPWTAANWDDIPPGAKRVIVLVPVEPDVRDAEPVGDSGK